MSADVMKSVCHRNADLDLEDTSGEIRRRQFAQYIFVHPTQLLGHVPSPQEMAQGAPLLAICDELQRLHAPLDHPVAR